MGIDITKGTKNIFGKFINLIAVFFVILILASFVQNLSKMKQTRREIEREKLELEAAKREKEEVEEKLRKVQSEEYIEKQLRDNLGLAKEGEIIVILPEADIVRKFAPKEEVEEIVLPDPNWMKWAKAFGIMN